MDHETAKVFHIGGDSFDEATFKMPKHQLASRAKGRNTHHRGETHDQKEFYDAIVKAVADAQEILVMGPGTAKLDFLKHVHKHDAALEPRIVGVESADHPTDGQVVAHARAYFRAKDQMLGTTAGALG